MRLMPRLCPLLHLFVEKHAQMFALWAADTQDFQQRCICANWAMMSPCLKAHRVGFGASGRNGGQLGSGQRMDQDGLEDLMGQDVAHQLWDLAQDAKALVKGLIEKHGIECHLKARHCRFRIWQERRHRIARLCAQAAR